MPDTSNAAGEERHEYGRVIRSTGSWYDVQVTRDRVIPSKVRGKFRLEEQIETNPVAVGDRVKIRIGEDDTGLIIEIHPRENQLSRRAAGRRVGMEHVIVANVDAAWTIQAVRLPRLNSGFIDRFLLMAEMYGLAPGIVFNKVDLLRDKDREEVSYFRDLYRGLDYPVLMTSAVTGEGIDDFRERLVGKTNVVTGPSGVGKSTLLNAVEPGLELRTAEVSERTSKGRHTTTRSELHPLSEGGYVADTPGIREFGVMDVEPQEVAHYFVEFVPYLDECGFANCTHDHEPNCAVKAAVDAGDISEERYDSYLGILDSVKLGERDVGR